MGGRREAGKEGERKGKESKKEKKRIFGISPTDTKVCPSFVFPCYTATIRSKLSAVPQLTFGDRLSSGAR